MIEASTRPPAGGPGKQGRLLLQGLPYAIAVLAVAVALGATILFDADLGTTPTLLFFAAVLLSTWAGGWGSGGLAAVLSTLAINYVWVPPLYTLQLLGLGTGVRLGVLGLTVGLIHGLRDSHYRANQAALSRERSLQAQLQATQIQLETVSASIVDQFLVLDQNWRYRYVSDRVVEVVGKPRADLLGQCIWEVFPDTVGSQFQAELQRAVAEQRAVQFEYFYPAWQRWFENRVYPSATGVSVLVTDITARKQAEDSLKRTNQTLQTLLDACPVAIAFFDAEGIVKLWNRAAERIFGWSAAEVLGQFMPTVPNRREAFLDSIATVLSGQSLDGVAAQHRRKDGQRVDLEIWANLAHDAEGRPGCLGIALDVSDRKQAEEALRQSEERLRVALKDSPITVFNQDLDLRYTWIYNPALGRSIPEVIGHEDSDFFPQEDAVILGALKRRVIATGVGVREEVRIAMPDQDYYYDLTIEPLHGATGNILGITCAAVDVTQRKQMELALRQSETTLSALIASSPIGIALFDRDLRYVHVNEALAATNGIPLAEHLGRTLWEVLPDWAPTLSPVLQHVMETKTPLLDQEVAGVTHPADVVRYGLVSYFPVYLPNGEVLGVGVTSMDITDRKQVEQELQQALQTLSTLIQAAPLPIVVIQPDLTVDLWNPAAERLFGWSEAELLGQPLPIIPAEKMQECQQLRDAVTQGEVFFGIETYRCRRDGSQVTLSVSAAPLYNDHSHVTAILLILQDITERQQAEAEREQLLAREQRARQQAETANRIKDEFLAVLSHELRSPLNPILGWSKLLQQGRLNDQATRRALDTIERNARLQAQLIDDLLDVSRILRGKLGLNVRPTNLVPVIESALETVRLAAEAKQIQLQTRVHLTDSKILGDSTRLQQIVWNLLSNAVKFTPGGGQVEVILDSVDGCAQIQVSDTGKGISPAFLPYVFDYFRQEDGKTTRQFGGLGLGLAIVRYLTELHGGSVRAESPGEGQGSTFTVRLPLMTLTPAASNTAAQPAPLMDFSQLQILVVDDEEDMRVLTQTILEQQGAQVILAASAAEALALLDQQIPDLLISDIGMPDMDGYQLLQQIRSRAPEQGGRVSAIALTAYAGEYDQRQALQVGFQRYLTKPTEPEVLVSAITALLAPELGQ
jgi:PAS domain S-box-containing protein